MLALGIFLHSFSSQWLMKLQVTDKKPQPSWELGHMNIGRLWKVLAGM